MGKARKDNRGRALRTGEIYREKEKRYRYSYTDKSGKRNHVYARDIVTLREKEDVIKRDLLMGIDLFAARHITLNDTVDRYLSIKRNLKESTKVNYIYMYDRFVRDDFGKRPIVDIKYSDVLAFYNHLVDINDNKPYTASTIHGIIRPALDMAVRDEVIRRNPCNDVMREINKKNKKKRFALTLPQQQAFMNYVHNHHTFGHWYDVFAVFLGTGVRVGEFSGLRWQDIDMENRIIDVNHALVRVPCESGTRKRRLGVSTPKTEAGVRDIPMMDSVYEAIMNVYEFQSEFGFCEAEVDGMSGFIFQNANGNPMCEQNINDAIKRILNAYNTEEEILAKKENRDPLIIPHFSCHHLRHTFCTRYCENEPNVKVIQAIMGHKNIKTTLEIYADATIEKKQESIENFSKIWVEKIMV